MTWAATTFAFFVFPRLRKLTCNSTFSFDIHLSLDDVNFRPSWGNPEHSSIRIKGTKTDPFRSGQIILIEKTNESVCPVKAMKTFISVRNSTSRHLFIHASGQPQTKDSFTSETRQPLSPACFNQYTSRICWDEVLHKGHPLPHRVTCSAVLVEWDPTITLVTKQHDLYGP